MNAVIYGAGNIGRGFLGELFFKAGCKITFIDINEKIVAALNEKKAYPVRHLSNDETEEIIITGAAAVRGEDEEEIADCIAKADIMACAVGVRKLSSIAPFLAGGFKKRFKINNNPLNIIICENLINADKYLSQLISEKLEAQEASQMEKQVGFVQASIGRMAPLQTSGAGRKKNFLRVCTEKYSLIPVDKNAFKGDIPKIEGIIPFDNFEFFIRRKFFIHNMGHALCAYMGLLLKDSYIFEAAARPDVAFIVQNAMMESAAALHKKYKAGLTDTVQQSSTIDHIRDLILRFNNRALKDTCRRVGFDIERKLGPDDRFIGAVKLCIEQGVAPSFISIGAAAALHCLLKERAKLQPRSVRRGWTKAQMKEGARRTLETISALDGKSAEAGLILEMYKKILRGRTPRDLLHYALHLGNKPGVI